MTPSSRIPSLDGLRGASFLVVFAAHAGLDAVVPGGFGVTVFFFLSGYLITTLLRAEVERTGTLRFGGFYLRRALRILPPFYLVLAGALAAAALGALPGGFDPRAVAAQALHGANYWIALFGYQGQPAGTGVYWSLAVEEHYYLLYPLLYLTLARCLPDRRRQALVLYGLCALALAWRAWLVFGAHAAPDRTYVATDARADSILFGCALAILDNPALGDAPTFDTRRWRGPLLVGAVVLLLATFVCRNPAFRETIRYSLQGIALTPVFALAVRYPEWAPFRGLHTRLPTFLGDLSYPLYLVHHVVLEALRSLSPVPRAAVALGVSLLLAWIIHELVERPCARLRRKLEAGRRAPNEGRAVALAEGRLA